MDFGTFEDSFLIISSLPPDNYFMVRSFGYLLLASLRSISQANPISFRDINEIPSAKPRKILQVLLSEHHNAFLYSFPSYFFLLGLGLAHNKTGPGGHFWSTITAHSNPIPSGFLGITNNSAIKQVTTTKSKPATYPDLALSTSAMLPRHPKQHN